MPSQVRQNRIAHLLITLETPFFLAGVEDERSLEFEFVGPSPWDFNPECSWQAAQAYRRSPIDLNQSEWVISGEAKVHEKRVLILQLRARARGARGTVPLETLELPVEGEGELPDRVARPLLEAFHAAVGGFS